LNLLQVSVFVLLCFFLKTKGEQMDSMLFFLPYSERQVEEKG
jgi:hypothetical protein